MDRVQFVSDFKTMLRQIAHMAATAVALGVIKEGSLDLEPTYSDIEVDDNTTKPSYIDGMSVPRADGAVRSEAWDDFLATDKQPGRERANAYFFTQDALKTFSLGNEAKDRIRANATNALFRTGFLTTEQRPFFTWVAFNLHSDPSGLQLWVNEGEGIADAAAMAGDRINPDGRVAYRSLPFNEQIRILIGRIKAEGWRVAGPGVIRPDESGAVS